MLLLSALALFGSWLAAGRSLLAGYGSRDILILVVVFAVVAVLTYLLVCGLCLVQRRSKRDAAAALRKAEALEPGMTAGDVLERLAVRKSDLWVSWALQRTGSGTREAPLPNDDRPDEPSLVCAAIELKLAAGDGPERPSRTSQQMEQELCLSLRPGRPAAEALTVLAKLGADADRPAWRPAKYLSGPEEGEGGTWTCSRARRHWCSWRDGSGA